MIHNIMLFIDFRLVLQCSTLGKEQNCSRVVHGAVIELHPEMVTVAAKQHGKQLRVVVSPIPSLHGSLPFQNLLLCYDRLWMAIAHQTTPT